MNWFKSKTTGAILLTMLLMLGFSAFIGVQAEKQGYEKGLQDGEWSQVTVTKTLETWNLVQEGYLEFGGREYELKYIENEGWFLVDNSAYILADNITYQGGVMYRLEVWLANHTPNDRYIYESFVDGNRRGVMSIYFARP